MLCSNHLRVNSGLSQRIYGPSRSDPVKWGSGSGELDDCSRLLFHARNVTAKNVPSNYRIKTREVSDN